MNANEQPGPQSRAVLDAEEQLTEDEIIHAFRHGTFENMKDIMIELAAHKRSHPDMSETLQTIKADM